MKKTFIFKEKQKILEKRFPGIVLCSAPPLLSAVWFPPEVLFLIKGIGNVIFIDFLEIAKFDSKQHSLSFFYLEKINSLIIFNCINQ